MSGPDIQHAYKEYERSFDELSQASAASPPLFKRRWGDGGVDDDDVSVLTAPVVHQQRRPSQRELERDCPSGLRVTVRDWRMLLLIWYGARINGRSSLGETHRVADSSAAGASRFFHDSIPP